MFRIITAAVVLLSLPWLASAQECPADRRPATVFFGNGVNTPGYQDAYERLLLLEERLHERIATVGSPVINEACLSYQVAFNYSSVLWRDILESIGQIVDTDWPSWWRAVFGLSVMTQEFEDLVMGRLSEIPLESYVQQCDLNVGTCDLTKQVYQYTRTLTCGPTDSLIAGTSHDGSCLVQQGPPGRVVVVAHSQGNLFANQAFDALNDLGAFEQRSLANFRVVSVATPTSVVAGESLFTSLDEAHTTLTEDFVADNLFLFINSDRLSANANNSLIKCLFAPLVDKWTCHLVEYHLNGTASGPKIMDSIIGRLPLQNHPPTAGFTMTSVGFTIPQSAHEGETLILTPTFGNSINVNFDVGRSSDSDGTLESWEWRLNGAIVSNASTFALPLGVNTYAVSLVVTDDLGALSPPATATIVVSATPSPSAAPTAFEFTGIANNGTPCTGRYTFDSSALDTNPDANIGLYGMAGPFSFEARIGTQVIFATTAGLVIRVRNNIGGVEDDYEVVPTQPQGSDLHFLTRTRELGAFVSDALPATPPWGGGFWGVFEGRHAGQDYFCDILSVASATNPHVFVSPESGPPGTVFRYTGFGFVGESSVISHLKRPDGTDFRRSESRPPQMEHLATRLTALDSHGASMKPGPWARPAADRVHTLSSVFLNQDLRLHPSRPRRSWVACST